MNENQFKVVLEQNGIFLTELQEKQFRRYFELLQLWNQRLNLTTIIQKEEVYEKHFFDSLSIAFNKNFNGKTLCDIGTGAGFPAIPLKIAFPNLKVTALDSMAKRINFVNEVIKELGLEGIETMIDRAENFGIKNRELYDIVVARAVSRLNILLEISTPLVKTNGVFIALKGLQAKVEADESIKACEELNLELVEKQKVILPTTFAKRYNLVYRKLGVTPKKYPRSYSRIKKKPL